MANLYKTRNVVNWSFFMLNNVARKIKVLFKLIFKWQQVSFSAHGFSSFSGVHFIQTGGKLNIYQLKVFVMVLFNLMKSLSQIQVQCDTQPSKRSTSCL